MISQPKPKRERESDYLDYVRALVCVVRTPICVHHPVEAHHVPPIGGGKTGSKTDDRRALPLCAEHHRIYHNQGRARFELEYGVDLEGEIRRLNSLYRRKPKQCRTASMTVKVKIANCPECNRSHQLPLSKVAMSANAIVFRCPIRNQSVKAER